MSSNNEPKLRMAPRETAEELARRVEREHRAVHLQRESTLEQSLAPFRVGSVRALNTVPLTRGLEDELIYAAPSQLAEMLRREELDAALVSIVEPLLTGRYDILDGIGVASLGEVRSVFLAHRRPLEEIREVFLDTASLTSVQLLKVLLAERGLSPEFKPLASYDHSQLPDSVLLIGDNALDLALGPHDHQIWDLGQAWFEMTGLPFVYAAWSLRRGIENSNLRRQLREARDFGLDTLENIIQTRTEYSADFRKDYLGWHLHYHLGDDEKRGIRKFMECLRKLGNTVLEPCFVA